MCCAKNRRCESYRVTSPLGFAHSIPGTLIRYVSLHVRVRRRAASLETLFLCLNRSPVRYGFRAGAKALRSTSFPGENLGNEVALRYSMNIYPQYRFSFFKGFLLKDAPIFTAQM